ncbi:hypothetical protein BDW42DRAFT_200164 [Aspergillus taichungensis]|uniref:Uncharacterized protein n=1 Tax=Aspergillus taichungensis TaxID=482145 RepID=A0A2J5I0Z2_9EURO|nr:hypothetical protein BDW42DRAFT_200164 [Aspergillus taichungensis]
MNFFQLLICACIALFAAAADWPGPQRTEMEDGVEVWKAKGKEDSDTVYTYKVNDLEPRGARPKIVYNCHKVPALCKNVRARLNGETKTTLHYDKNLLGERHKARRDQACPHTWIDHHQCPEPDQPENFWYFKNPKNEKKREFGQRKIVMMMHKDEKNPGELIQDRAQFGQNKIAHDAEGNIKVTWSEIGATFSCDEWPAASWIEGGEGVNTYLLCLSLPLETEQNWQASAHGMVKNWYDSFYHQWDRDLQDGHDINYEIFKFDFEMVNEPKSKFGTWLEALGRKRYCFSAKHKDEVCKKKWDEDPEGLFEREDEVDEQ